jgi:hypothetical protein
MINALDSIGNIVRHADVNVVIGVIPLEGEVYKEVDGLVNGDGVFVLKNSEVFSTALVSIPNSKGINNMAESDGVGVMLKETRGVGTLVVFMKRQVLHQGRKLKLMLFNLTVT